MYPGLVYQFPEDIIIRNMGAAKIANNCITSSAIHRLSSVNKIEKEEERGGRWGERGRGWGPIDARS